MLAVSPVAARAIIRIHRPSLNGVFSSGVINEREANMVKVINSSIYKSKWGSSIGFKDLCASYTNL